MSEPEQRRPGLIPGGGGLGGKNEIPYGLTKAQYVTAIIVVIALFFVAFGVALTMQG